MASRPSVKPSAAGGEHYLQEPGQVCSAARIRSGILNLKHAGTDMWVESAYCLANCGNVY